MACSTIMGQMLSCKKNQPTYPEPGKRKNERRGKGGTGREREEGIREGGREKKVLCRVEDTEWRSPVLHAHTLGWTSTSPGERKLPTLSSANTQNHKLFPLKLIQTEVRYTGVTFVQRGEPNCLEHRRPEHAVSSLFQVISVHRQKTVLTTNRSTFFFLCPLTHQNRVSPRPFGKL